MLFQIINASLDRVLWHEICAYNWNLDWLDWLICISKDSNDEKIYSYGIEREKGCMEGKVNPRLWPENSRKRDSFV